MAFQSSEQRQQITNHFLLQNKYFQNLRKFKSCLIISMNPHPIYQLLRIAHFNQQNPSQNDYSKNGESNNFKSEKQC